MHFCSPVYLLSPTKLAYVPTNTVDYIVLYCNRFVILFTQIIQKKTSTQNKTCLILQYSSLESTIVQHNSWNTGAGIEQRGKKGYRQEEGGKVEGGRAEGLSATGDGGGQAAISLMLGVEGTGSGSLLDSILSTLLKK